MSLCSCFVYLTLIHQHIDLLCPRMRKLATTNNCHFGNKILCGSLHHCFNQKKKEPPITTTRYNVEHISRNLVHRNGAGANLFDTCQSNTRVHCQAPDNALFHGTKFHGMSESKAQDTPSPNHKRRWVCHQSKSELNRGSTPQHRVPRNPHSSGTPSMWTRHRDSSAIGYRPNSSQTLTYPNLADPGGPLNLCSVESLLFQIDSHINRSQTMNPIVSTE